MSAVKTATDQLTSKDFKERDLKAKVEMKQDTEDQQSFQSLRPSAI